MASNLKSSKGHLAMLENIDATVNVLPEIKIDSKRTKVVNEILFALFKGDLHAGERLVVANLANHMNISATPIREALVELESIGIVTILPHRGAICNPFGPKQLSELFQIRRILEVEAIKHTCDWLSQENMESLLELKAEMEQLQKADNVDVSWSEKEVDLDICLHDLIAEYCGSHRLKHEIKRYGHLMTSLRISCSNWQNIQQDALNDHIAIIDALLNQNKSLAANLIQQHIENTGEKIGMLMFLK